MYIDAMSSFVVGADPGRHGAVVVLDYETGKIVDMIGSKIDGDELNVDVYIERLAPYAGKCVAVWQEKVHAIFGSSAGNTFAFGDFNGALRASLRIILGVKPELVSPKVWQKTAWKDIELIAEHVVKDGNPVYLKSGAPKMDVDTKATSLRAAQYLFPGESFILPRCRTPHDGVVDAALIAYYGLNKLKNPDPVKVRRPRKARGPKVGQ